MSENIETAEQSVELSALMVSISDALAQTAEAMDNAFMTRPDLKDRAVIYQIPRMTVSVRMTMSFTQGKVRGILWNKESSEKATEVTSTISMDFVAIPRPEGIAAWRDMCYTVPMMSGSDVRVLQMKLQEYARLKNKKTGLLVDGEFGTLTRDVVQRFQGDEGLPVTGTVDRKSYDALLKHAADPPRYSKDEE